MNTKCIILSFVPGILFAGCLSSCWTFIGYGMGAWADNGAAHDTVPIFRNISSYTGQAARIQYPDSSIRYATFEDYSDEPAGEYRKYYDQYVASHPKNPAALTFTDTITAQFYVNQGLFAGYFPEGIIINNEKLFFVEFNSIIFPEYLSRIELKKLFESNAVPIRATLNFREKENDFGLTNHDFLNVFILPHSAPGKWIGLATGAALDITLFSLYIYYNTPPRGNGSFAGAHYNGGKPQSIGLNLKF